ncbi:alpha-galactosidase [Loktanella sp. DSM 29012]|uniref:alpha-galactosidase n=1 Tax=Loktanella sp. DSM 29012 TaxID=1881056 RepID=UPI0008BDC757|nr:alpha-galactosidase [Loktanella sp. DSM 29012]SEQ01479.1 alpha-galactosidase [Loktanella sp. DSM 29012]
MTHYRLDDDRQTLVLHVPATGLPACVYWGARLPDAENLTALTDAVRIDMTGGSLDANPALTLCPQTADAFPGQPGLTVRGADGSPLRPVFTTTAVSADDGLTLVCADRDLGLTLTFHLLLDAGTRMLVARTTLDSATPVLCDWLTAPVLPAPQLADEVIDFAGRWCDEFQTNRTPWSPGIRARDNRTGRTGHEHFPACIMPARGTTNTAGQAWAIHYGWSGGHKMLVEELQDGRRQVQFGHATGLDTAPATRFQTAPIYATFSDSGFNGCATTYQRHLRDRVVTWPKPDTPRPVHYNCWEAIYFDHDLPALTAIADRAAAIGAERFVLDDGWFGRRDDDTTSLGDWTIDPRKYPDGLTPLIDHIAALGMTFGIWFEPEMINADSDLARAHPDWILGPMDQPLGRQQYVLDMANPAVRDHLFMRIDAVLADHAIDYVKWDHNRVLPYASADQTRGTYDLLDRLRAAHPGAEIESCASGGGRIDFGVMQRTQRVWLSDCNDALERLRIQHDAALFLPAAVTGSHVGPRKCHTTGRIHDIAFRGWVAAQRHMGFEMDPRELTDQEAETLTRITNWFKANRDWMRHADIMRLDSADPAVIAEQQLSARGDRFVVFAGKAATSSQIAPRPLRLTGLEADATYRVQIVNPEDLSTLSRGTPALKSGPVTLSGRALMEAGLALPYAVPDSMWVLQGERL